MKLMKFSDDYIKQLFFDKRSKELFDLLNSFDEQGNFNDCFKLIENIFIAQMDKYEREEIYLPEYLTNVIVYNNLLSLLEENNTLVPKKNLRVYVCNPKNDLHSIGKNLLKFTLISMRVQVFDGGATLTPQEVIEASINKNVDVIAISAMLLNTRYFIEEVINWLVLKNYRDKIKIFIGGAAVDIEYSKKLDVYYSKNIVTTAKKILSFEKQGDSKNGKIN